jgi:hypothetical protein
MGHLDIKTGLRLIRTLNTEQSEAIVDNYTTLIEHIESRNLKAVDTIDLINERLKQNFTDAELRVRIRTLLEAYYADQE